MGKVSKLHKYALDRINSKFSYLKTRENYYPDWLTSPIGTRLELDIFIDELNIAAEIQGKQHSVFIPFFHGSIENFEKRKEYDEHKRCLCRSAGVRLYDIATEQDADIMIYEIEELINRISAKKSKYFYHDDTKDVVVSKKTSKEILSISRMVSAMKKRFKNASHINAKLDISAKAIRASFIHKIEIPEEIAEFIKINKEEVYKRVQ